ncbi:MAG TPA: tetratricopeptide repeat protein [Chthoniobacteraceae bacterium]
MKNPPPFDQACELAKEHLRQGRSDAAESVYREVLARDPKHAGALHGLGVIAAQLGKTDLALALLSRSAAQESAGADVFNDLGNLLFAADRRSDASAAYQRAIEIDPRMAAAHNNLGNLCQIEGRLDDAIAEYRKVLSLQPQHPDAWNNLGVALQARGDSAAAIEALKAALQFAPNDADAHYNLGVSLQAANRHDEALEAYREAIRLDPSAARYHNNLGDAALRRGRIDQAIAGYREALRIDVSFAPAQFNLGNVLRLIGRYAEAEVCYRKTLAIEPGNFLAAAKLGDVFAIRGELAQAMDAYQRAIELNPRYLDAYNSLGIVLQEVRRNDEAIAIYRRILEIDPEHANAEGNLGAALSEAGQMDDALELSRRATVRNPQSAIAHNNLAGRLKNCGRIEEAIAAYRTAVALAPDVAGIHSNLVFTLSLSANVRGEEILAEARAWAARHEIGPPKEGHQNDRSSDRPLRVGYVSGDFCDHVVGRNILPILRAHDRQQFRIYAYSNLPAPDALTLKIQALDVQWRSIVGVSDEEAAAMIRADEIDILVDLGVHTARNRLPVFGRRPAPVQVTYLGYCGTSGLQSMDYRLSDHYLDPPAETAEIYSERTLHLPRSYWLYVPPVTTALPSGPPALAAGSIVFGCLNNFAKVSPDAMQLWLEILAATPGSRLLLHAPEGSCRTGIRERFAHFGLPDDRLEFIGRQTASEYLQTYREIDICLDPFPYGGGITTCDAMWMGVPVVSLIGSTAVGRGGYSILSNLGLERLAAKTAEEYVAIAVSLAGDRETLANLRATLRARMENSALRDPVGFTRNLETVYRQMWLEKTRK